MVSSRLTWRLASRLLLRNTTLLQLQTSLHHHQPPIFTIPKSPSLISFLQAQPSTPSELRFFSTARRQPVRSNRVDIGARARQLQNRRLWTYALTFSCIAGFVVIVLNNFQDQLVFCVTPTDAFSKYSTNPSKSKFRLGGLVLEGSVAQPASSPEMEFVITDLITDILVRYQGSSPDLFRCRRKSRRRCRQRLFLGRRGVGSVILQRRRCWQSTTRSIRRRRWRQLSRRIRRRLQQVRGRVRRRELLASR